MTCRPLPHAFSLFALASVLAGTVAGCGSAENEGFPPKPEDIPQASFDSSAAARWKLLAKELRIDDGTTVTNETDLTAKLSSVSSYLTSSDAKVKAEFKSKLETIGLQYAKESYKARCASIDLVQEISDAKVADSTTGKVSAYTGAKLYLMTYRLQADAKGTAEPKSAVRSGLVVMPTTNVPTSDGNAKKYPLVAYGHGGDNGLTYGEIMAVFGAYQGNHIIAAPSFPGEPICKGGIDYGKTDTCDKDGKIAEATKALREPFVTDTDELLGMHDCLVRAAMGVDASLSSYVIGVTEERDAKGTVITSATKPFQTFLTTNVKRIGGTQSATDPTFLMPVSYMAGLSRGGFTAQLALAKAGGTLGTLAEVQKQTTEKAQAAGVTDPAQIGALVKTEVGKVVGTNFFQPPRFSCALDLFGPSTFLATSYRLGLEAFVKGYGNKTSFYDLPTGEQLFERWKAYGDGVKLKKSDGKLAANDAENAKAAAELLFKMDVPLQTPFILGALRNWSDTATKDQGAMLILHGLYDKVVPAAQSQVSSTIYFGVNAELMSSQDDFPGVNVDALGLTPPAAFLTTGADGKPALKAGVLQHGDVAFFTSTYTTSLRPCSTGNATLDAACKAANAAQDAAYAKATPQTALVKWLTTDCANATTP